MQIKKSHIIVPVLSALMVLWALPAKSYDVLLTVRGAIKGNTCLISAESKDINVPLGNIGDQQFLQVGATGNIKSPFVIRLEQCGPTFEGAKVRFSGDPAGHNSEYLKIAEGGAEGVAVQILDSSNEVVPLNHDSVAYPGSGKDSLDLQFYAQLVAINTPVKPGEVSAMATYIVEYL